MPSGDGVQLKTCKTSAHSIDYGPSCSMLTIAILSLKTFEKIENSENFEINKEIFASGCRSFGNDYPAGESSPLQVSGAVTRLTVYRAATHNLQRRGFLLL